MALDKLAAGKELLKKIMEIAPESVRAALRGVPEADVEQLVPFLGESGLRQEEFSRVMGEANLRYQKAETWHEELGKYHDEIKGELEEGREAKTALERMKRATGDQGAQGGGEGGGEGAGDRGGSNVKFVDQETFDSTINKTVLGIEERGLTVMNILADISDRHREEFGTRLDRNSLITHARKTGLPLNLAWEDLTRGQRDENSKKKQEEEIAAAEKRGEERAAAKFGGALPYPTGNPAGGGFSGTLSGLAMDKAEKAKHGVDAATRLYHERVRGASGG